MVLTINVLRKVFDYL